MTQTTRVPIIRLLAFGVLIFTATAWAQNRPPILEQIAKTYGVDSFGQIEAIRYTWNGEITGLFKLSRKWEWEPKTGKVSFEGKDKDGKPVKVTYMRSELNDDTKKQTDAGFTNDNYWLLFPLHAYWDTSATVTDEGMKKLPVGPGSATLVSVKYGAELGGPETSNQDTQRPATHATHGTASTASTPGMSDPDAKIIQGPNVNKVFTET